MQKAKNPRKKVITRQSMPIAAGLPSSPCGNAVSLPKQQFIHASLCEEPLRSKRSHLIATQASPKRDLSKDTLTPEKTRVTWKTRKEFCMKPPCLWRVTQGTRRALQNQTTCSGQNKAGIRESVGINLPIRSESNQGPERSPKFNSEDIQKIIRLHKT